jgi:hypothetical protein
MDTEGNNILVKCNFQNEMGIKPKKQNPSECKTDQTTNICKKQPTRVKNNNTCKKQLRGK